MGIETSTIELEDYSVTKRPSLSDKEKVILWVRSGGRCAICNKYLLELNYDVNIAEIAHIVGWSKAKKSPRGEAELVIEERNKVDNLILLCADHHKIIDTASLLQEFTIERLMKHKANHENRIFHLTAQQIDSETVVLRMFGGIRGAVVEVSKENARNIVFNSENKHANFIDSFDKHGIEIDLNSLLDPEENWDAYWLMGKSIIDKSLLPLFQGINKGNLRHLSVFAMTRIPLLVYLGYKLSDKISMSIYQKHRGDEETWMWSNEEKVETFEVIKLAANPSYNVALIISLSGSINIKSLPENVLELCNIYEIRPIGTIPNRNIFRNKTSYENFNETYNSFLSQLEIDHKECSNVHLFPSIPVSGAISCGRGVMRDAQPALIIYDLTKTIYKPTIIVNEK